MAHIEALGRNRQWELLRMDAQAFPCVGNSGPHRNRKRWVTGKACPSMTA